MKRCHPFSIKNPGRSRSLITEVLVGAAFASTPGAPKTVEGTFACNALWDTGATNCAITQRVVDQLGLTPIEDEVIVQHADGESKASVCAISIFLPNKLVLPVVFATVCKAKSGDFDIIIGMDVISQGDFAITAKNGKTTFSFCLPSIRDLDFEEEEREYEIRHPGHSVLSDDEKRKTRNKRKSANKKNRH